MTSASLIYRVFLSCSFPDSDDTSEWEDSNFRPRAFILQCSPPFCCCSSFSSLYSSAANVSKSSNAVTLSTGSLLSSVRPPFKRLRNDNVSTSAIPNTISAFLNPKIDKFLPCNFWRCLPLFSMDALSKFMSITSFAFWFSSNNMCLFRY